MSLTAFIVDQEMAKTSKPASDLTNGSVLTTTDREVDCRRDLTLVENLHAEFKVKGGIQ